MNIINISWVIGFLFLIVALNACQQNKKDDFTIYNNGKSLYDSKCVACHGTITPSTYPPTLLGMHLRDSLALYEIIGTLKKDSNHSPFLVTINKEEISELCYYIRNFKTIVN